MLENMPKSSTIFRISPNKNITMNQICDRIDIGYAIYDMDPDSGELEVIPKLSQLTDEKRKTS